MPRGVAIPDLRAQLFRAAERVLARDGPSGLTSRAITEEAGVAKGVLHNHFTDLDGFLAEFVMERMHLISDEGVKLRDRAGEGTVVGNLTEAAVSAFGSHATAMLGLAMARPAILPRLQHSISHGSLGLQEVEASFAAYLDAEKDLGRISPDTDTQTTALAIVGTVHHLFMTQRAVPPDLRERVLHVVEALLGEPAER